MTFIYSFIFLITVIIQQKHSLILHWFISILAFGNSLNLHIFEFSQFRPDLIAPINFESAGFCSPGLMVRENHKMVREMSGKSQGILWGLMAGHPEYEYIIGLNAELAKIAYSVLTLKRPGLCGWLRPTQFKPRLDWVGSAAQVRRYCVDSAAQAFIHALAGCVPRSLQYALCGPRNSRPAHFAAHALDVLAAHESPSLAQLST